MADPGQREEDIATLFLCYDTCPKLRYVSPAISSCWCALTNLHTTDTRSCQNTNGNFTRRSKIKCPPPFKTLNQPFVFVHVHYEEDRIGFNAPYMECVPNKGKGNLKPLSVVRNQDWFKIVAVGPHVE